MITNRQTYGRRKGFKAPAALFKNNKKDILEIVYFSFFLLMLSVYVSFISYSQIWQSEALNRLIVGGKSNRAVLYFQEELKRIVQKPKN